MASVSVDEESTSEAPANERKQTQSGICIDSSRIQTTTVGSSEVQDELSGLGVNVYNQQEFEAGVLKQIDSEVNRRNAEQDKKFVLQEHSNVKTEINFVRHELDTISKTIAGLLVLPMSSVGMRLRELRAAQDQKKQQLQTLNIQERNVLKKLNPDPDAGGATEPSTGEFDDVPFGFPMPSSRGGRGGANVEGGGAPSEEGTLRLIQTGELTPFGTSVDTLPTSSHSQSTKSTGFMSAESALKAEPANADCKLGISTRRKCAVASDVALTESHSHSSEPNMDDALDAAEDWMPSLADFLESNSSSGSEGEGEEYFTDEDLGHIGKKKKKKLRDLSSDDLSGIDEPKRKGKWRRRRKGRGTSRKKTACHDDGDEDLYRQRLREYEVEESRTESTPADDVNFDGGLTIPGAIWHRLYRYQQTGVKWLWELHTQLAGGVVGDEMGLGKTIQMIAFFAGLKISNLRSHVTRKLGLGPVLIVCPATVMHQWVAEFHKWWPPFRVAVFHGTGSHGGSKKALVDEIVKSDGVLVTTYSGIRLDQDLLLAHKWDYVVLDEGHKIRNPDAEITLACKQVTTPHRLILSGSPMQNNLRELWSLFDFVFPGKLGTLPIFMEQFSVPITLGGYANATEVQVQTAYKCACILRDTINPYMLRRLKADVKIHLPDKNEQVLFCRLTDYQCELYRDYIQSKAVQAMLDRGKQVFSGLMALRKLCNHPDLVTTDYCEYRNNEEEEGGVTDGPNTIAVPRKQRRKKITDSEEDCESEEVYGHWRRSGKMIVVESLLKLWWAQGHRVLLFSQSKAMLDILEKYMFGNGYTYQRMDGTTPISSRQPLVNKFNEDRSIFVFLLTTRVGGLGINLTGADRVIIYDPDWNPSTDTQARERAWRIGQKRQVTIYRLLTSGTIEEKIYHRQIFKQFLTNRVLKDPRQRRFFKSNNLHELFTLSSSAVEGSTETSALFAGTGSEIVPKRSSRRTTHSKARAQEASGSHDPAEEEVTKGGRRKRRRKSSNDGIGRKRKSRSKALKTRDSDSTLAGANQPPLDDAQSQSGSTRSHEVSADPAPASSTDKVTGESGSGEVGTEQNGACGMDWNSKEGEGGGLVSSPKGKTELRELKRKKRKKKHKKRGVVDGESIEGLDYTSVFNPGQADEERQDDLILHKLFKKSGVHSALQHDTIMNSDNPDYVLVEAEASKVAKSASKALKVSRRQCVQMGAGRGRPTWTGQHGVAGAPLPPAPRFGSNHKAKLSMSAQAPPFSGVPSADKASGSLNTSSSVLLAKMRQRNVHTTSDGQEAGVGGVTGIHGDSHGELVREIRDFIAIQGKVNGQATTSELLERFAAGLPHADVAVFRSMLYEICDFSRHRGDGLWCLKTEFR